VLLLKLLLPRVKLLLKLLLKMLLLQLKPKLGLPVLHPPKLGRGVTGDV